MKPLFCFIDDAEFELENFRQFAAPAFERVEFVYAKTFEEARHNLKGRLPLCFLLDLYGTDTRVIAPQVPDKVELAASLGNPPTLDKVYEGLSGQGTELGNLFLRRLYAQVDCWQRTFLLAAGFLGQGLNYGLANLEAVRATFPWAAAVGYSRKSLYADAVRACLAEMDGLLQKPQGGNEGEIAEATRLAAPALAQAAYRAVDRRLTQMVANLSLQVVQKGFSGNLVPSLVEALKHMGIYDLGKPARPLHEVLMAFSRSRLETAGLDEAQIRAAQALSEWLGIKGDKG